MPQTMATGVIRFLAGLLESVAMAGTTSSCFTALGFKSFPPSAKPGAAALSISIPTTAPACLIPIYGNRLERSNGWLAVVFVLCAQSQLGYPSENDSLGIIEHGWKTVPAVEIGDPSSSFSNSKRVQKPSLEDTARYLASGDLEKIRTLFRWHHAVPGRKRGGWQKNLWGTSLKWLRTPK